MQRISITPRANWQSAVEKVGLTYHTQQDGTPYWDESACWEFAADEIDRIEAATAELHEMSIAAADYVLTEELLADMAIPEEAAEQIYNTWQNEPPSIYGRLDLAYDGDQIKLLEYNADTPTALVESAVAQWYWLEDCFPQADQFNSLHEKLVAKWRNLTPFVSQPVYFGHDGAQEDEMTVTYLRDTAQQAGLLTEAIQMVDIGLNNNTGTFVDLNDQPIRTIFKLYPWEALLAESFGQQALQTMNGMQWIEPIWKMLWSNKALLAVLWEMYPDHELLLPAFLGNPNGMTDYARKPIFGREGSGITLFRNGAISEGALEYDPQEAYVYQALAPLAQFGENTAVIGSWLIDGEPSGMGIRESHGSITTNMSRFVPHYFR